MLFSNFARIGINIVSKRFTRKKINLKSWPNDWVPFVWNRPQPIAGYLQSGDLVKLGEPKADDFQPDLQLSDKLKQLSPEDPVRKILSLDHAKRVKHREAFVQDHMKKLGLIHILDYSNSREAKIISLTFTLRQVLEFIEVKSVKSDRYIGKSKTLANSLMHRRYRYLCELKELHEDRYERLINTLNIEPKNNLINVPLLRPYRKIQMRRLAIEYARDLKDRKVQEFMASLDKEKAKFEESKRETLKWIEEQEKKLGVTV